jgi:hypothetical protein
MFKSIYHLLRFSILCFQKVIINLYDVKNLNNDDFKVEELEQRLEMAEWSNESIGSCTSGDCSGTVSAKLTFNIFE